MKTSMSAFLASARRNSPQALEAERRKLEEAKRQSELLSPEEKRRIIELKTLEMAQSVLDAMEILKALPPRENGNSFEYNIKPSEERDRLHITGTFHGKNGEVLDQKIYSRGVKSYYQYFINVSSEGCRIDAVLRDKELHFFTTDSEQGASVLGAMVGAYMPERIPELEALMNRSEVQTNQPTIQPV